MRSQQESVIQIEKFKGAGPDPGVMLSAKETSPVVRNASFIPVGMAHSFKYVFVNHRINRIIQVPYMGIRFGGLA
jgi:hypothetical protein